MFSLQKYFCGRKQTMKKRYVKMESVTVGLDPENGILSGSRTLTVIDVENVEVESFEQGFGTDSTNDFQDVNFD